jgi:hypothetical protein
MRVLLDENLPHTSDSSRQFYTGNSQGRRSCTRRYLKTVSICFTHTSQHPSIFKNYGRKSKLQIRVR